MANGDLCTVKRVGRSLDDYPLKLVSLELTLSDVNEEDEPLDGYAFTELLYSDLPQLSEEQVRMFQQVLMAEWELEEKSVRKRWAKMKTDPVANALQIKFGYALTCHKSQGGQWDAVFVDHGFLKEGPLDTEFYRWFYTAVTRARKEVFIINPDKRLLAEQVEDAD